MRQTRRASAVAHQPSFRIAGYEALANAAHGISPQLLEPHLRAEIIAPTDTVPAVAKDLNTRAALMRGPQTVHDNDTHLTAEAPLATMIGYAEVLRSLTGGAGTVTMTFTTYREARRSVMERIGTP